MDSSEAGKQEDGTAGGSVERDGVSTPAPGSRKQRSKLISSFFRISLFSLCSVSQEIAIRVFRTAHELGLQSVAIYSYEDRFSAHRNKADEAYMVGKGMTPVAAYLAQDEIIKVRYDHSVPAPEGGRTDCPFIPLQIALEVLSPFLVPFPPSRLTFCPSDHLSHSTASP
jgi:hypothetical protein